MDFRIEFTHDPPRATVTTSGPADVSGWTRYHEELLADPRFHEGMSLLVDHSELDAAALTVHEVRQIGLAVAAFDRQLGIGRRAVVAPGSLRFGLTRMAQVVSDPEAARTGVFTSVEEAIAWLDEPDEPKG